MLKKKLLVVVHIGETKHFIITYLNLTEFHLLETLGG